MSILDILFSSDVHVILNSSYLTVVLAVVFPLTVFLYFFGVISFRWLSFWYIICVMTVLLDVIINTKFGTPGRDILFRRIIFFSYSFTYFCILCSGQEIIYPLMSRINQGDFPQPIPHLDQLRQTAVDEQGVLDAYEPIPVLPTTTHVRKIIRD